MFKPHAQHIGRLGLTGRDSPGGGRGPIRAQSGDRRGEQQVGAGFVEAVHDANRRVARSGGDPRRAVGERLGRGDVVRNLSLEPHREAPARAQSGVPRIHRPRVSAVPGDAT